jgi:hypothetical protein
MAGIASVIVSRGLEHQLAHAGVRSVARGQHADRSGHVDLVGVLQRDPERIVDQASVDHGVNRRGAKDAAKLRVLGVDTHELCALELVLGVVRVDPDDRLDAGQAF